MQVKPDDTITVAKTVSEFDVYQFAGLSGDFYEAHVNQALMEKSAFGERIAHGALLVGFMSAAGTALIALVRQRGDQSTPVSLGYDGIKFVEPVRFGDTVTVRYTVESLDVERHRSTAAITVTNQHDRTVAVAKHIMKWLPKD
ncbi:MaoC/PaaZ C-terminal domain-containing protein [Chelativorans sp. YIM 93263]|uniref:MaoC/PaaZ C-terminal domain-containing protein n=1 Tax=Chelativorans sp. YIM 93263 TaxID=2906648 RepID=UPI002377D79B|nr:MaoC/PaaZ C-terminal domain-containing protein [Chelativorans sp. YIM 93263]